MKILHFLLVLTLFVSSGCSTTTGNWWKSSDRSEYLVHTVRYPGEHLFLISHWYTGSGHNWRQIQLHNPELKPESIRLGQQIRIPKMLIKRSKPLTRSIVTVAHHPSANPTLPSHNVSPKPAIGLPLQGKVVGLHTGQVSTSQVSFETRSVKIIEGCEHFEDNATGLSQCAQLLEKALGNLSEY